MDARLPALSLLWLTAEAPNRGLGGGNIRQSQLLDYLARHGVAVDLVVADSVDVDAVARERARTVTQVPVQNGGRSAAGPLRRVRILIEALGPGGPAERRDTAQAVTVLRRMLRPLAGHDLVVVEHTGLSALVTARRPGETWVLTAHNVFSLTAGQALEVATSRRSRFVWRREVAAARRFERRALEAFDAVVSVSDDDARALPGPTTVIPNGVDLGAFGPTPLPATPTLFFSGSLNYLPNVDGIVWFVNDIFPKVRERVPDVALSIVGRSPVDEVVELAARPGVSVTANVPDIRPYVEAAKVVVVPLRMGSGTRLKVLEALASARPVVGTTIGLAGLGLVDQRDAIICDEVGAMADALVGLLADEPRCAELAGRGPQLAAPYSWERVGARYLELLTALQAVG